MGLYEEWLKKQGSHAKLSSEYDKWLKEQGKQEDMFTRPGEAKAEPFKQPKGKKKVRQSKMKRRASQYGAGPRRNKPIKGKLLKPIMNKVQPGVPVGAPYTPINKRQISPPKVRRSMQIPGRSSSKPNWRYGATRSELTGRNMSVPKPKRTRGNLPKGGWERMTRSTAKPKVMPQGRISGPKALPMGAMDAQYKHIKKPGIPVGGTGGPKIPKVPPGVGQTLKKVSKTIPWAGIGMGVKAAAIGYAAYDTYKKLKPGSPYQKKMATGRRMNKIYDSNKKYAGQYTPRNQPYKEIMSVGKKAPNMSVGSPAKITNTPDPGAGKSWSSKKMNDKFNFGVNKKIKLGPAPTFINRTGGGDTTGKIGKRVKRKAKVNLNTQKKRMRPGSMPAWKPYHTGGGGIPRDYSRSQIVKSPQYRKWKAKGYIKSGGKRTKSGSNYGAGY